MFGFTRYNYDRFDKELLKDMLLDDLSGPEPGDRAPDFRARTLDGGTISLRDYRGEKNVVLTFGSATCPATAGSIGGLNQLYREFDRYDVQFLFCYVREAHPGDRLPAHATEQDKRHAAELLRDEEDLAMPVIVDDVKGGIHKKYGKLPNSTYLIDQSGRVAFRSLWTRPSAVRNALEELLERQQERGVEHAVVNGGQDRSMPQGRTLLHTHRALKRGGRRAMRNFEREMGVPGRFAVAASRVVEPVADNPARVATVAALTAGVVVGGILLGRFLRQQRFRTRTPYDIESMGVPRRAHYPKDYEAVGI